MRRAIFKMINRRLIDEDLGFMLLDPITRKSLITAARQIDTEGVPKGNQWTEFWITINGRDYQFKHLIRKAYRLSTGRAIDDFKFTSSPFTRGFITKKFGFEIYFKVPNGLPFFTKEDLNFFSEYAGRPYRKGNKLDEIAGKRIRSTIFTKTNTWLRLLNLEGYETKTEERWQLGNYFKRYSWARIYKSNHKKYKVFFTIGVNCKHQAFVMKIDCQRSGYSKDKSLPQHEVDAFDRVVGGGARYEIPFDKISSYSWEKLYTETNDFIQYFDSLYEEAIVAVQSASTSDETQEEPLEETPVPERAYDDLPDKVYSFKGVIVNYEFLNRFATILGTSGEGLVIEFEKRRLIKEGRGDLCG